MMCGVVQMPALLGRHVLRAELARLQALKLAEKLPAASWGRQDDLPAMLLHWAAFIASRWGLELASLGDGVADGRLLCLLVRFSMLSRERCTLLHLFGDPVACSWPAIGHRFSFNDIVRAFVAEDKGGPAVSADSAHLEVSER